MKAIYYYLFIICLTTAGLSGCVDDPAMPDNLIGAQKPKVETGEPKDMTPYTVEITGSLLAENGAQTLEVGFVWYEADTPGARRDSMTATREAFRLTIEGLNHSTAYVVQAYAKNEAGVGYGEPQAFETILPIFNTVADFSGSVQTEGSATYLVMKNKGFIIGGDKGNENINEIWEYTPGNSWKEMLPFSINETPIRLSWMSGASTNDAILLYGGKNLQGKFTSDLYAYRSDNSWVKLSYAGEAPGPIISSMGCYTGGEIYFFGGKKMNSDSGVEALTNEIWTLNPLTIPLQWRKKDFTLPEAQYGGIALVVDAEIYVGLGKNSAVSATSSSNRFWSSSLSSLGGSWTEEMKLPTEAIMKAGVAYGKSIYVVDDAGYIWEFATSTREWTRKSMLPTKNQTIHCMYTLKQPRTEDVPVEKELIYIGFGNETVRKLISYDPTQDIY